MREILFRGKCVNNSEWVEGYFYESKISGCYILVPELIKKRKKGGIVVICDDFKVYEIIFKTVGRYTGLKDKNGTKIFEGDILKFIDGDNEVSYYEVVYSEANCRWIIRQHEGATDDLDDFVGKYMTVVGNIYDNPKLLEV